MSTLEIAGLTGKAHKNVLADARKMMSALEIQPAEFSARYLDGKGEAREVLNLPKRECLILVSGYSVEMRARIIDRWMQLEAAISATPAIRAGSVEEIERTFGIVRMLAHKITVQEKEIRELRGMIEVNPYRAAPEFIAPIDLVIEYGAERKGRRPLSNKIGNRMAKRAEQLGVYDAVIKTAGGRRLFQQKFARTCMREFGLALIEDHNRRARSEMVGQRTLKLVAK